ncbi:MAG TPA: DoxX family protein [Pyrinomonadaceae bacterium]|nr:DoxX family protein [Pyrinomonadaceae bacterium]
MEVEQTKRSSKKLVWIGRILSGLPVLFMVFSGVAKLLKPAQVIEGFQKLGYPDHTILPLGVTELLCTILYVIPQTSVLGAILMTAYLGGATATHVRVGEPFFAPIILGMVAWLGLFLRDSRLRALLPLRS